jgi:hypothetical protein
MLSASAHGEKRHPLSPGQLQLREGGFADLDERGQSTQPHIDGLTKKTPAAAVIPEFAHESWAAE